MKQAKIRTWKDMEEEHGLITKGVIAISEPFNTFMERDMPEDRIIDIHFSKTAPQQMKWYGPTGSMCNISTEMIECWIEEPVEEARPTQGKIYIAGPMRGYKAYNYKEFFVAQDRLEKAGWKVVNPAELDAERYGAGQVFNIRSVLIEDMKEIIVRDCTAIFMLEGFDKSDGARAEMFTARAIGLKVFFQSKVDADNYARETEEYLG